MQRNMQPSRIPRHEASHPQSRNNITTHHQTGWVHAGHGSSIPGDRTRNVSKSDGNGTLDRTAERARCAEVQEPSKKIRIDVLKAEVNSLRDCLAVQSAELDSIKKQNEKILDFEKKRKASFASLNEDFKERLKRWRIALDNLKEDGT